MRKQGAKDITVLNAKIGAGNRGYEQVIGRHGLGTMNENGELFAKFCALKSLVIGGSVFPSQTHTQGNKEIAWPCDGKSD